MGNSDYKSENFSGSSKKLKNHKIECDINKWIADKIEYEEMLHRVFGKGEFSKKDSSAFEK